MASPEMLIKATEQMQCTKTKLFLSGKEEAVKTGEWAGSGGTHF